MLWRAENRGGGADFDQPASLHDADPFRKAPDEIQIVSDQDHRHAELALQLRQQLENLRLNRHIERGGRLVGDQQLGAACERHRDHRALALAARELVRIAVKAPLGLGDAGAAQQLDCACRRCIGGKFLVQLDRLRRSACRWCRSG